MGATGRRSIGWLTGAMVAALVWAAPADAFIYWVDNSNEEQPTIGRANNDGTGIDRDFITGLGDPCGISSDGTHLYWGNRATNSIGRANLDGSGVNPTFIVGPGGAGAAGYPCDPEAAAGHIWWANGLGGGGNGAVARANLDGSAVDSTRFNSPAQADTPIGLATSGNLVFWSNAGLGPAGPSIGRAGADGVPAPNRDLVTFGMGQVTPLWLDATDSRIYATLTLQLAAGYAIGSWDLGGGDLEILQESVSSTGGLAVHGGRLYWANGAEGTVSASALDGSDPDFAFIRGIGELRGLEVDSGAPPSNAFELGKLKRNKRRGTGKLTVRVPGPGALGLAGAGLKPKSAVAGEAGKAKLPVAAKGNKRRALEREGQVRLNAEVTFLPDGSGGQPATQEKRIKLVRR